jgi:hypothetical protein
MSQQWSTSKFVSSIDKEPDPRMATATLGTGFNRNARALLLGVGLLLCVQASSCSTVPGIGGIGRVTPPRSEDLDRRSDSDLSYVAVVPQNRAIVYLYNNRTDTPARTFSLPNAFSLVVSEGDYIAIEAFPGKVHVGMRYDSGFGFQLAFTRDYSLVAGQKLYLEGMLYEVMAEADFGTRLERWKRPIGYIKLCDQNTRVCGDSPWQSSSAKAPPGSPHP